MLAQIVAESDNRSMKRSALRRILVAGLLAVVLGAAGGVWWCGAMPAWLEDVKRPTPSAADAGWARPFAGQAGLAGSATGRPKGAAAKASTPTNAAASAASRSTSGTESDKSRSARASSGTGTAALLSAQALRRAARNGGTGTPAAARPTGTAQPGSTPPGLVAGDDVAAASPTPTPTPDPEVGAIRGVVLKSDGSPTTGAWVTLTVSDRPASEGAARQVTTGPAGDFAFEGLPLNSPNSLRAHAEGYGDAEAQGIVATPAGTAVELVLAGTGRLAGSVVRASDGAPLPAVIVRLGGTSGGIRQTQSDEAGQFSFGLLPTGVYQLAGRSQPEGAVAWICEPLEGLAVQTGGTLPVQMRAWPPASVRGAVLDRATQAPVPGTEVQMVRFRPPSSAWGGQSEAGCGGKVTSDADGAFALQGLLAGDYQVYLRNAQYAAPSKPEWLTVSEGDALEGVQFWLESGGTLMGSVVDGTGQPAEKVGVQVEQRPDPFYETLPAQLRQTSDATGRFAFQGLRLGREYRVTTTFDMGPDGKPRPFAATDYRLLTDETPEADLVLRLTAGLAVRGVVTDEAGQIVGGATVSVRGPAGSGPWHNGICGSAMTDANGAYSVAGLSSGDYSVGLVRAGFVPPDERKVTLAGADAEGVNFALRHGAVLRGLLVDLGVQRLSGWQVSAVASDPANPNGPPLSTGVTVTTGGDGSFQLEGLAGTVALQISHSIASGQTLFRSGDVTPGGPDNETVLVVPIGGALAGQVVDTATGAPVDDFSLDLRLDAGDGSAPPPSGTQCVAVQANLFALSGTGRAGAFATPPLPAGKYSLHLSAPGRVARDLADVLVPAEGRDLGPVTLTRGATLMGRLVDAGTGQPYVPDNTDYGPSHFFAVVAEGPTGESSGILQGEVQADGTFFVAGVPLAVSHAYLKVGARLPVDLTNLPAADATGVVRTGDVRLDVGSTVRGRVTAPNGAPLNRVQVIVSCPGHDLPEAIRRVVVWRPDWYYASGLTREDGTFEVRGAFPGAVTVFAVTSPARYTWAASQSDPYKSQEASATASANGPVSVELRFR